MVGYLEREQKGVGEQHNHLSHLYISGLTRPPFCTWSEVVFRELIFIHIPKAMIPAP